MYSLGRNPNPADVTRALNSIWVDPLGTPAWGHLGFQQEDCLERQWPENSRTGRFPGPWNAVELNKNHVCIKYTYMEGPGVMVIDGK